MKGQPDRISYSFGMKLSIAQYESADFHITMTTDARDGETAEEAYERARQFVQTKAEEEMDGIRRGKD